MSTDAKPEITASVPWFGAKRGIADQITVEFGKHSAYWEIFCGSMAMLIAKERCGMETVNDLHGELINLARTIQHPTDGPKLYRRLRRTMLAKAIFEDSAQVIREQPFEPTPDRAFHYFVVSWFGRNGVAGTSSYNAGFCVRYTKNGGHGARRFSSAVRSIPSWRERMRNVTILNQDAFELLERIEDAPGVVIFADPPYVEKAASYRHDFEGGDHERLATALRRFKKTRVVLSYYEHQLLNELYRGWTKRRLTATKAMANQGKNRPGSVEAPEILLINGPSYCAEEVSDGTLF